MADRKFLTNINLGGIQLKNVTIEVLTSDPAGPNPEGRLIYRSDQDALRLCTVAGSPGTWVTLAVFPVTSANIQDGTITDVDVAAANKDGAVGTASMRTLGAGAQQAMAGNTRLDQITAPTALVNLNNQKITNLGAPSASSDAARLADIETSAAGLDVHPSVRVASTANVNTASAPSSIDGVTLANNDRVLLKNQTTTSQNGIWVFSGVAAAMSRASDASAAGELSGGSHVFVEEGTTQAETGWVITTNGSITPGTTAHVWSQFAGNGAVEAGAGLTRSALGAGSTIDVGAGTGISVGANTVDIDQANVPLKNQANFSGDGSTTSFTLSPSGGTPFAVTLWDTTSNPYELVEADITLNTIGPTLTVTFAVAPAVGKQYTLFCLS